MAGDKDLQAPLIPPEHSAKLKAPAGFSGPTEERSCTDIFCLLIMYSMWIVMSCIGIYSCIEGDYRVVLYPMDYDGNICGTDYGDIDMSDYKYLYYINSYTNGVCVKECPTFNTINGEYGDAYTLVTYGGIWQVDGYSTIPADYIQVADYSSSENVRYCTTDVCYPNNDTVQSFKSEGINEGCGFAFYAVDTEVSMHRCSATADGIKYVNNVTKNTDDDNLNFDGSREFFPELYADLWVAKFYILGFGVFFSLFLSYTYAFLLRVPGFIEIMVWGSIAVVIVMVFGTAGFTTVFYINWKNEDPPTHTDTDINSMLTGTIFAYAIGLVMLCITCFLRKQILLAMGCTEAASRAISAMKNIIFLPIFQALGLFIFKVIFLVYAVHISSIGERENESETFNGFTVSFRLWKYGDFVVEAALYLYICFFVTVEFIVAVGSLSISISICKWYFTRDKSKINLWTVYSAVFVTLAYHQGTAAFGSFVISVTTLIRGSIAFLRERVKDSNNRCAEIVLCCCGCFFWCFERFMKFINRNAYVQTALFGYSFCEASKESFFLIKRNASRIAALVYVSEPLTLVGRLLIMTLIVWTSYLLMESRISDEVNSLWGPCFVTGYIAYFVAKMFMDMFDMAVITILQCFIADEEMFDGDDVYAEGELKRWLDKWGRVDSGIRPESIENIESTENMESIEKMDSMKNLENMESIEKIDSMKNLENMESIEKMDSMKNLENMESIEKMDSMKNMENMELT